MKAKTVKDTYTYVHTYYEIEPGVFEDEDGNAYAPGSGERTEFIRMRGGFKPARVDREKTKLAAAVGLRAFKSGSARQKNWAATIRLNAVKHAASAGFDEHTVAEHINKSDTLLDAKTWIDVRADAGTRLVKSLLVAQQIEQKRDAVNAARAAFEQLSAGREKAQFTALQRIVGVEKGQKVMTIVRAGCQAASEFVDDDVLAARSNLSASESELKQLERAGREAFTAGRDFAL